jgi:dipeptidase D
VLGGSAKIVSYIGGWLPASENKLADLYEAYYKKLFNISPKQVLITGGVEPAFVLTKCPNIIGISIGPNIENVHSPDERVQISSVEKVYRTLGSFLATIK